MQIFIISFVFQNISENHERISNVGLKDCILDCDRRNNLPQTLTSKVKQIQENYVLDLICREEKRLHFRINDYHLKNIRKIMTISQKIPEMERNNTETSNPNNRQIFVIKLITMDKQKEYKVYLVSSENPCQFSNTINYPYPHPYLLVRYMRIISS